MLKSSSMIALVLTFFACGCQQPVDQPQPSNPPATAQETPDAGANVGTDAGASEEEETPTDPRLNTAQAKALAAFLDQEAKTRIAELNAKFGTKIEFGWTVNNFTGDDLPAGTNGAPGTGWDNQTYAANLYYYYIKPLDVILSELMADPIYAEEIRSKLTSMKVIPATRSFPLYEMSGGRLEVTHYIAALGPCAAMPSDPPEGCAYSLFEKQTLPGLRNTLKKL